MPFILYGWESGNEAFPAFPCFWFFLVLGFFSLFLALSKTTRKSFGIKGGEQKRTFLLWRQRNCFHAKEFQMARAFLRIFSNPGNLYKFTCGKKMGRQGVDAPIERVFLWRENTSRPGEACTKPEMVNQKIG